MESVADPERAEPPTEAAEAPADLGQPEPGGAVAPAEPEAPEGVETVPGSELAEIAADVAEPPPELAEAPVMEPELSEAPEVAEAPPPPAPEVAIEEAPASVTRTVGQIIADALKGAGVTIAFTVPGESFLGLLDGLSAAGIRIVTTRHEGGAAFMAEAHGQLTGRPAACVATRAVGAANLAIGIHTARADSAPMFAIVGGVTRAVRGREAFQEADVVGSIGRLAKWAIEIESPARAEALMAEAVRHALAGRPGPVLISVPEDVLDETVVGTPSDQEPFRPTRIEPEPADVVAALQLLACARQPVILAGAGVLRSRGTADLVRLAELLEVPVVASWRRGDVFPNDHRLYLGMTGFGAPSTVRARLAAADAILVLGCRLNEIASFDYAVPRDGVPWAHVDLEPRGAHVGLSAPTHAILADARTFLRVARRRLSSGVVAAEPLDARRAANAHDRAEYELGSRVDDLEWDGPGVHPGRVVAKLDELLPPQAILTTDAGNFGGWAARGYHFRRPGTFLGPTSGAMGYALPAAVAAALEYPGRPVVALAGDGGFAMTLSELETAVREGTKPVVLVFDNARYGTIRAHQDDRGTALGEATDLGSIDFAAVAEGFGARGLRVATDAELEPALQAAFASDRPAVVQLSVDRRWRSVGHLDPD